jgi:hypothetical protein
MPIDIAALYGLPPLGRVSKGRPVVEQTIEAMLFLERHRDNNYKGLTDVGIWFLKRTMESLGKVLGKTIEPDPPPPCMCAPHD